VPVPQPTRSPGAGQVGSLNIEVGMGNRLRSCILALAVAALLPRCPRLLSPIRCLPRNGESRGTKGGGYAGDYTLEGTPQIGLPCPTHKQATSQPRNIRE
jgi:hypothetical protein